MQTHLLKLDSVVSTNDFLFEASLAEHPFGTALLAARQTAGHGRAGRVWQSEPGGMYLSVLLKPRLLEGFTLLGALCVVRMCAERYQLACEIRWPNDVYVGERKLAGILPKAKFLGNTIERAVLGVGLNVCQSLDSFAPELANKATTLSHLHKKRLEIDHVVEDFLEIFQQEYELFERSGCGALVERCGPFLQGRGLKVGAKSIDGKVRVLGVIQGLGSRGELCFESGPCLENLGPNERLAFLPL